MMADIEAGKIDVVVIYKIDRLTRSLADFSKMVEVFERFGVSFVRANGIERLVLELRPEPVEQQEVARA